MVSEANWFRAGLVTLLVCSAAVAGIAAVPSTMNYQGRLTNAAGQTVSDGMYNLKFRIYDAASIGTVLWAETLNVAVSSGLFSTPLGGVHPLTGSVFSGPDRWLGVASGSDAEMTPRAKFATVAYAFAVDASSGAYLPLSGGTLTGPLKVDLISEFSAGSGEIRMGKGNFGSENYTSGSYGIVAGQNNWAQGAFAGILSGRDCATTDSFSVISGGSRNAIAGRYSSISGGQNDSVIGYHSVIGGGRHNVVAGDASFIGGGDGNRITSSSSAIASGLNNRADFLCFIGTGTDNVAKNYGFVGSGGANASEGDFSAVGGGWTNKAGGQYSFVGSGSSDTASGDYASVVGGNHNVASGPGAVVAGGQQNTASGPYSGIFCGTQNIASGWRSFAGGLGAHAHQDNCFVFGDGTPADYNTDRSDQAKFRVSGGFMMNVNNSRWIEFWDNGAGRLINTSTQAYLSTGGTWTNFSDRRGKENFVPVDGARILDRLAELPVMEWSYKTEDSSVRHIGPTAQDFYAAFGVGNDSVSISTIDPSGIALAAIKELNRQNKDLRTQNAELMKRLDELSRKVEQLSAGR